MCTNYVTMSSSSINLHTLCNALLIGGGGGGGGRGGGSGGFAGKYIDFIKSFFACFLLNRAS